jgi:hypothetical protein
MDDRQAQAVVGGDSGSSRIKDVHGVCPNAFARYMHAVCTAHVRLWASVACAQNEQDMPPPTPSKAAIGGIHIPLAARS